MSMRGAPFLYRFGRWSSNLLIKGFIGPIRAEGVEHIPSRGPFLLISNHQSILDPFFVQIACPRPVHTMAKSSQFAAPGMRYIMPRVLAFPVRRYRVDPQPVRYALRRLAEGEGVGIYLEGERTWDGRPQPARRGTLRLILRAGVPVVTARIDGAYDVWPRWASLPARGAVHVRFDEPLLYPAIEERSRREHAMPALEEELVRRLGIPRLVAGGRA